jgi:hypothetical protein
MDKLGRKFFLGLCLNYLHILVKRDIIFIISRQKLYLVVLLSEKFQYVSFTVKKIEN